MNNTMLRDKIAFAATLIATAFLLAPMSAQAACDGGACPITGGSLRTMVGAGFVIPQVVSPFTGPGLGGELDYANTAMGAILPRPDATAVVNPLGNTQPPFSISVPLGQYTYGDADPATANPITNGRFTTPVLVQVPLFPVAPALMGVSTNIGQSFPGAPRTFMNVGFTTTIGGPAMLRAGGRPGAQMLNTCAGAIIPNPIPSNWNGGCVGFTPTTGGGSTGVQVAQARVTYFGTANQFGGVATQRQVKRTPITAPGEQEWLGRINFNRFIAPYTVMDMADTINPKTYPTLPQNLVEPVVWGATFGAIVQRFGAAPGDLVSGRLTPSGAPVDTATQVVVQAGGGLGQTSTSWGGPLTTGRVQVQAVSPMGVTSTWTNTGNDSRTVGGAGWVSLVSGSLSSRSLSGDGTQRTLWTLQLPEPSMALGMAVGVAALLGAARRRKH